MRNNVIETIMGAVVLLIAGIFLTFAYTSSGYRTAGNGVSYQAAFDRVDGLVVGGDVRMSGVKIGSLQTISLDPKSFLAQVKFIIGRDILLPRDSSAEIVSDGLMGGKYLNITPGGDEETLKEGERIDITQSSVSLESMIGQLIFNAKDSKKKDDSSDNRSS